MKGTPNYAVIHRKGQKPMETRKIAAFKMNKGDMVSLHTGGGGGWGEPLERDVDKVRWDALNDYITPEQASSIYGVVINPKTLKIEVNRTKNTRETKIKERSKEQPS